MSSDSFEAFIANIPLLHSWDKGQTWNTGGFGPRMLRALNEVIGASVEAGASVIAETGAGNSTILFLLMKPQLLYSIAPEAPLRDRILAYCEKNEIDHSPLDYAVAKSEVFLPKLAAQFQAERKKLDVALIDGGHGWPTVFVDFCYFNMMLKKGGLLIVDDLQLYSVNQLARWLSMQPEYSLVKDLEKTLVFRKETDAEYFGDHVYQPYIQQQNKIMKETENPYSLT